MFPLLVSDLWFTVSDLSERLRFVAGGWTAPFMALSDGDGQGGRGLPGRSLGYGRQLRRLGGGWSAGAGVGVDVALDGAWVCVGAGVAGVPVGVALGIAGLDAGVGAVFVDV